MNNICACVFTQGKLRRFFGAIFLPILTILLCGAFIDIARADVDKTALIAKIAEAEDLLNHTTVGAGAGQVTIEAYVAMETAINEAKTVRDDDDADQMEVDQATSTLDSAMAELEASKVPVPDKTILGERIDHAEYLRDNTPVGDDKPGYAPQAANNALAAAIATAIGVYDDPLAIEDDVVQAVGALDTAIETFEAEILPFPDKIPLNALIGLASVRYSQDREGPGPWELEAGAKEILQTSGAPPSGPLPAAADVYNNPDVLQPAVDAALANLQDALDEYETKRHPEAANKPELAAELALAKAFCGAAVEGTNAWNYRPGATNALNTLIDYRQDVYDNKYAYPNVVDAAINDLFTARAVMETNTMTWVSATIYHGPSPAPLTYTLTNATTEPFEFECDVEGLLQVAPLVGELEPGESIELTASWDSSTLPVAVYGATNFIKFKPEDGDFGDWPARRFTARLTVARSPQTIDFTPIPDQPPEAIVHLSATASSGLTVYFEALSGPAFIQGDTNVVLTGLGEVEIKAWQDGNENWLAAPSVIRAFECAVPPKPVASLQLGNLYQVYNGAPRAATLSTEPPGLLVHVTYDGSPTPPVHAGTYNVEAVVDEDEAYAGFAAAVLVVNKASQSLALPVFDAVQEATNRVPVPATASSGLPVEATVQSGPGRILPGPVLSFYATGRVEIAFSQPGNRDWFATSATKSLQVISSPWVAVYDLNAVLFRGRSTALQLTGDSEVGYLLNYRIVTPPAHGRLSGRPPEIIYTPISTYLGMDSFTYEAHDGYKSSEPASVSLFMRPKPSNDYEGRGASSIAIYNQFTGDWTIRTLEGTLLAWAMNWGGGGYQPLSGDFEGDGIADLMVYWEAAGLWFGMSLDSRILLWAFSWGGPGFVPVCGDFDADGCHDLMLYQEETGRWFGWSVAQETILDWAMEWGGQGFAPAAGNFSGSFAFDYAVMNRFTGQWYIRARNGDIVVWGERVAERDLRPGDAPYVPVCGDFDGDLTMDMGVYDPNTGKWYIKTTSGQKLAWGLSWGGSGFEPVCGDFNGDGIYDLAVYEPEGSRWFIYSLDGRVLAWDLPWGWGGPQACPVGP